MALPISERIAFIRTLETKYYDASEVITAAGIQRWTLTLWRRKQVEAAKPSAKVLYRGVWIYLWDENALRAVIDHARLRSHMSPGRKTGSIWTADEIRERDRVRHSALYHEKRSKQVKDRDQGERHARIARELRAQLAQEHDLRACCGRERAESA